MTAPTKTTFIITGFGPFGTVEENPTTVIIRHVSKTMNRLRDTTILKLKQKQKQDEEDDNKKNKRQRQRIILLHLGVARTTSFRLESCAYNEATFRIPDICGYQPKQELIIREDVLEKCYKTTLDLTSLCTKLTNRFGPKICTEISTNPGRYVCNYVYCTSLQIALLSSSASSKSKSKSKSEIKSVDINNNSNKTMENHENNESTTNNTTNHDDDDDVICSLFLHVPSFSVVPEEEQLSYVAGLLQALI
ncbi:peptidase C15, pyroglutamyl peptidase I-like protein [Fragilariopsis cylindrus CCMP1102]|uniref:Peptidase C15, pyroglutamyl peptidase I-like protein n=1 Tax=Fragilariopsis cylindrus CCMP1102 TaxID=635003 RepID=A0A1E7FPL2_9STRA|nr:peptidase C15, pyroglutamyl peptidase I-like protein [Fragilariopsis cylindrus CCMP1102]|eukprot:OEU20109.1 peptidase C15, pyroglutamyl peptidase I-like protein [Fragilariopsis cylindrus CCMP1102]